MRFPRNGYGWVVLSISLALLAGAAEGADWHVAPTGTPEGDGSVARPWDLSTALKHPANVRPGDTILLAAGTYRGADRSTFSSRLQGAPDKPIVVRPDRGAHVLIQPTLELSGGGHVWFRDLEVMNPDTKEYARTEHGRWPAVWVRGANDAKLVNMIVHDGGQGIGAWMQSSNIEIYGCLIFNNGWAGSNQGHAIYTQNQTGYRKIIDCMLFNGLGEDYGLHAYGSEKAWVDNHTIEGNIIFQNGGCEALVGSGQPAKGLVFRDNCFWSPPDKARPVRFGYSAPADEDAVIRDNYFGNRRVVLRKWNKLEITGNTFIGRLEGLDPSDYPRNTYLREKPKGVRVFVRPNAYQKGRAHVAVFNWDGKDKVDADLSDVLEPGQAFEVRDAQDFLGKPAVAGTYDGKPVALPMTLTTVRQPVSSQKHPHTTSEFGAFVVVPAGAIHVFTPGAATAPATATAPAEPTN